MKTPPPTAIRYLASHNTVRHIVMHGESYIQYYPGIWANARSEPSLTHAAINALVSNTAMTSITLNA